MLTKTYQVEVPAKFNGELVGREPLLDLSAGGFELNRAEFAPIGRRKFNGDRIHKHTSSYEEAFKTARGVEGAKLYEITRLEGTEIRRQRLSVKRA